MAGGNLPSENFNVPSYFEPFQGDQPELLGTQFTKFVNDYKQDARDFTRTHFELSDGITPKIYRNQPPHRDAGWRDFVAGAVDDFCEPQTIKWWRI